MFPFGRLNLLRRLAQNELSPRENSAEFSWFFRSRIFAFRMTCAKYTGIYWIVIVYLNGCQMISLRSLYVSFSTYVSLFIYFYIFFGIILLIWHDIDLTWLPPAQTLNVCEGLKKVVNKSPFPLTNVIQKRFKFKKTEK